MNKSIIKTYLFIAGLISIAVGGYISLAPQAYLMSLNGSSDSISILSDLRGMGGMILVIGVYIIWSVFRTSKFDKALLLSVGLFATFFIFRALGFALDGIPQKEIIVAYFIEGSLCLIGYLIIRNSDFKKKVHVCAIEY